MNVIINSKTITYSRILSGEGEIAENWVGKQIIKLKHYQCWWNELGNRWIGKTYINVRIK